MKVLHFTEIMEHLLLPRLLTGSIWVKKVVPQPFTILRMPFLRQMHLSLRDGALKTEQASGENEADKSKKARNWPQKKEVDVETSIEYLHSKAYQHTYGDVPIWKPYRRNFKGQFVPRETRRTCVRKGLIKTGNPCPICRDEYLVLHPKNIGLLKQFISPYTGEIISYYYTGLCRKQHRSLAVAVEQARDKGWITQPLPFREYDYSHFYPSLLPKAVASANAGVASVMGETSSMATPKIPEAATASNVSPSSVIAETVVSPEVSAEMSSPHKGGDERREEMSPKGNGAEEGRGEEKV